MRISSENQTPLFLTVTLDMVAAVRWRLIRQINGSAKLTE